ncbi:MAG: MmgE/PrpD family protein [Mailhella sp.]|nr:MmgE/PrpD family protein [Mailhella sp.]
MGTITEALADFAFGLRYEELPKDVLAMARMLLCDHLACTVGGMHAPVSRSVEAFVKAMGGAEICRIPGTGLRTSPTQAAFLQATAANALDYDDTGSRGHPGASIIPPLLALAQAHGISGRRLLSAMVVGYEINDRVAHATLPSPERYSAVHANGSLQAVGSAAACAHLLGLSRKETLDCIGIAGAMAPVPHAGKFGWEDKSIASIKDNVALPAENAVKAALLASYGYEGSESIMDGPGGFWAMLGSDRCQEEVFKDFSKFTITEVSLKPYPCCRWIHTVLDALRQLRASHAFSPADIAEMRVATTPPIAAKFGKQRARTFLDMEFSTPLTLSLFLHDIPFPLWHRAEHWDSPAIRETASRITMHADDELWQRFLELGRKSSCIPARVSLVLRDGTKLEGYCDNASGTLENPISLQEREEKWLALLTSSLNRDAALDLLAQAASVDSLDTLDSLMESAAASAEK